jgi:NADH-quinone oxidoreductase subunit H
MANFWTGYAWPTVITAVEVIVVVVPLLLAIAMLTYAERKVLAFSQLRKGPNVVGPFGLLQPFADGLKLLVKETIIPSGANRVVFVVAPLVTFTLALVAWAVIPFDSGVAIANINVGILYLFAGSSWPAGLRIPVMRSSVHCARRRKWCHTRWRSVLCS